MPYKFEKANKVWWPVTFSDATDGSAEEFEVEFLVQKLSRDEQREWTAEDLALADAKGEDRLSMLKDVLGPERAAKREKQVLSKIHGWRGIVVDDEGKELEFSQKHLKALWQNIPLGNAMERAIREVAQGGAAKN